MPFLNVNNVTFPIANETPRRTIVRQSSPMRSFRGQVRDPRRGIRRSWAMETAFASAEEATAFQNLLHGRGHFFDLRDGLHASTGLGPRPGYDGFYIDPTKLHGSDTSVVVFDTAKTGEFMSVDAQLADDWTILWYEDANDNNTWAHMARTSDGRGLEDGVRDDDVGVPAAGASEVTFDVIDGVVRFQKENGIDLNWDDVVILPYLLPDSFITQLSAAAQPFGPCPLLLVEGDTILADLTYAFGEVTQTDFVPGGSKQASVGWMNDARVVRFNISEVTDTFVNDTLVPAQGIVDIPNTAPTIGPIPDFLEEV